LYKFYKQDDKISKKTLSIGNCNEGYLYSETDFLYSNIKTQGHAGSNNFHLTNAMKSISKCLCDDSIAINSESVDFIIKTVRENPEIKSDYNYRMFKHQCMGNIDSIFKYSDIFISNYKFISLNLKNPDKTDSVMRNLILKEVGLMKKYEIIKSMDRLKIFNPPLNLDSICKWKEALFFESCIL
jgi:hypothetical protein